MLLLGALLVGAAHALALLEPESFLRGVKALDEIAHFDAQQGDGLDIPGGAAALAELEKLNPPPLLNPPPEPPASAPEPQQLLRSAPKSRIPVIVPTRPATLAPVEAAAPRPRGETADVHAVAALRGQLAAAKQQRQQMSSTLAASREQQEHFDEQLASEQAKTTGLGAQLANAKAQVASLETKLHRVGGIVDHMKAADAQRLRKTQGIARAEAHKVQQLETQHNTDASSLQAATAKIAELESQLDQVAHERDENAAQLPTLKALQAATDHTAATQLEALKAAQANSQTLHDELQRTRAEVQAAQQKLQTEQAAAAEAKRADKTERQALQAKWINFTASVQGVLHREDSQLVLAKAEAEKATAALADAKQEKAVLSTRLSDVSTEAQRMGTALKAHDGEKEGLEAKVAALQKQQRAAAAAAERNAARAEALQAKLATAEAALNKTKAAELAHAKDAAVGNFESAFKAEAEAKRAREAEASAEARVRELQNVTAQDAQLLRAAAARLKAEEKKLAPDKELLGQLSRSEKRLKKALTAWKREKEEVHKLQLAAQRDDTEKAQLRTRIAQQRQELARAQQGDEYELTLE